MHQFACFHFMQVTNRQIPLIPNEPGVEGCSWEALGVTYTKQGESNSLNTDFLLPIEEKIIVFENQMESAGKPDKFHQPFLEGKLMILQIKHATKSLRGCAIKHIISSPDRESLNTFWKTLLYEVCPESIQPYDMKNRDIYRRRYKVQETLYIGQ